MSFKKYRKDIISECNSNPINYRPKIDDIDSLPVTK